jgi:hypothetical protein
MSDDNSNNLPTKPSFTDWLQSLLPFKLPRIPLPQVAKNFDKAGARLVSSGLGNLSERLDASSQRIAARSKAETALINRVKQYLSAAPDIPPDLQSRALEHALGEAIIAQSNREKILELTVDEVNKTEETTQTTDKKEDAKAEIDTDWLNLFTKYAETKSNEDVQKIWARILASEIRTPGSTSLRTLEFLASVDTTEANRIVHAFSYVINSAFIPHFIDNKGYLLYSELLFLQEVGIITGAFGLGGPQFQMGSTTPDQYVSVLEYFKKIAILSGPDSKKRVDIPAYPLTELGRQVFAISETSKPVYDYFEEFCKNLPKAGLIKISIADFVSRHPTGIQYSNEIILFSGPTS